MIILLSVISIVLAVITLFLLLGLYKREDKGTDDILADKLVTYERNLKEEFAQNRRETAASMGQTRKETTESLVAFQAAVGSKLDALTKASRDSFLKQLQMVQNSLKHIQESNEKKLEEMRVTVDEKLQSTLEKRLTSSFELVTAPLSLLQSSLRQCRRGLGRCRLWPAMWAVSRGLLPM